MFKFFMATSVAFLFAFTAQAKIDLNQKHVPGELIVKFKNDTYKSSIVTMSATEKNSFRASNAKLYKFPSVLDMEKTIAELESDPNVEYVELNGIYELQANIPDDERFDELFGMHNEGQTGGTEDADIDALEAWDETVGSRDVLVGVIDTGIDYTHPDIEANYWSNPGETGLDADGNDKSTNGIDDDENGYVDDFRGWDFINGDNDPMDGNDHGTHCAGTIGAVGNNGIGVAGVNWEVSLVGLKIFSDAGRTTTEAIIEAIEYSTMIGVDVTNNSWGGGPASEAMQAAISEANEKDILFVAAAGNNRSDNDARDFFPANYDIPNIISVAAIDHNDGLASFSNYGATKVDVGAPGVNILSTFPGNRYGAISGTSMAAPHVTGLVALVKSKFIDSDSQKIKARILNTGDKTNSLQAKTGSGRRINAANALEIDEIAPNAPSDLSILETGITSLTLSFTGSGDDGDEGTASAYEVKVSSEPITEDSWDNIEDTTPFVYTFTRDAKIEISSLELNSTGYIALRAIDNLGNISPLSENITFATREVSLVYANNLESLDDFSAPGEWGIEEIDGKSFLTESPNGKYTNSLNTSIVTKPLSLVNQDSLLLINLSYDLEKRFDNAYIDISTDSGETWTEISTFTGVGALAEYSYELKSFLGESTTFQLRFRVKTDTSQTRDGLKIDEISIISAID